MKQLSIKSLSPKMKFFLIAIAIVYTVAMIILIISYSSAATATGRVPALAISLVEESNTGILGPGEQLWFKFTAAGDANQVEQALTLFFTPGDEQQIRQVSLRLFEENQLPADPEAVDTAHFGAGQPVSRDNNPRSGELLWNGWLFSGQNYYLQLKNDNAIPVDYWLLTDDVMSYPIDVSELALVETEQSEPVVVSNEVVEVAVEAIADLGATPNTALPLIEEENRGKLKPGEEIWFSFVRTDLDSDFFEEMSLTLYMTPNDFSQINRVNFDVLTADEVSRWSIQDNTELTNVGAGSFVERDDNPLTGARFWTGWVVDGDLYFVRLRNGSDSQIDYWLFDGDIYSPELGE